MFALGYLSVAMPMWHIQARVYPGFSSVKRLGVLLEDASPSQVNPSISSGFPDSSPVLLGGERHCESKVSCPRTRPNDPARARTQTHLS